MAGACLDSSEQLELPLAASRMCCAVLCWVALTCAVLCCAVLALACAVLALARAAEKATEVEQCLALQGYECPPNLRIV